ncbi:MAG: hypothetical protein IPK97_01620 [Ahniella sp.]|nr:hypothetical protein [Ahniella sp.]
MSDGRIKDIDQEVLPVFMEEVADFLDYLGRETSILRVRKRIGELDTSCRQVGARTIAARTSSALSAIATASEIDLRVVIEVRELTWAIVQEAQEASALTGINFNGGVVELKVAKPVKVEKPWWQVW